MSKISPKKYAVSLYEAIKAVPKEKTGAMLGNFIKLLAKNNDLSQADKIIRAYNEYANLSENVLELSIISVEKIDENLKNNIVSHLGKTFNKKIELHEKIDKSLIGGAVLKYGDTVVDGSIKKRLATLKQTLK
ncbi:MAG: ATP synthase F1 subunit delta [Patescibacteria group bacterium]|jgi:F-type H+-transporting ATPase subunit delta